MEIEEKKTKTINLTFSIPEGSVLGPVFSLFYISDITNDLSSKITVRPFGDDCLIYSKLSCHEEQFELASALQSITNWCTQWQMKINHEKTVYARITRKTENCFNS